MQTHIYIHIRSHSHRCLHTYYNITRSLIQLCRQFSWYLWNSFEGFHNRKSCLLLFHQNQRRAWIWNARWVLKVTSQTLLSHYVYRSVEIVEKRRKNKLTNLLRRNAYNLKNKVLFKEFVRSKNPSNILKYFQCNSLLSNCYTNNFRIPNELYSVYQHHAFCNLLKVPTFQNAKYIESTTLREEHRFIMG